MTNAVTGGFQREQVRFAITRRLATVYCCHCRMCQCAPGGFAAR